MKPTPSVAISRGRVGGLTKSNPQHPKLIDARRELEKQKVLAHIAKVAGAVTFTAADIAEILAALEASTA